MRKGLWLGALLTLVAVWAIAAGTVYSPVTALKVGGGYGGSGVGGDAAGATIEANGDISTNGSATVGGTVSGARVNTTGGVHVGGTSDPGTDNLIVDGTSTLSGNVTATLDVAVNGGDVTSSGTTLNIDPSGAGRLIIAESSSQVYNTNGLCYIYATQDASTASNISNGLAFFRKNGAATPAHKNFGGIYCYSPTITDGAEVGRLQIALMGGVTPGTVEYSAVDLTSTTLSTTKNIDTPGTYQAGSGNINLTNSTGNLLWAAMETPTIKETLILTGAGGEPTVTAGCYRTPLLETPTNKRCYRALKFDDATDESACWNVTTSPENCPTGATFIVKVRWKAARTGNVCFAVSSVATGHDDPYDAAKGTAVTGTVAVTSVGDEIVSSLGTMTPGGSFQAGDSLYVEAMRDANNAADTLADAVAGDESGDIEILGVSLDYTPRVS